MNDAVNLDEIRNVLKGDNNIVFALVFGSRANGQANQLNDPDIGIFTKNDIPLLGLGRIVSDLEKIVRENVDLVVLNGLYKRKPNFAFQVISVASALSRPDPLQTHDLQDVSNKHCLDAQRHLSRLHILPGQRLVRIRLLLSRSIECVQEERQESVRILRVEECKEVEH